MESGKVKSCNIPRLAARVPRVKMASIDYAPGSTFDIDPQHWP
jgi:hypothetical protein